MTPIHEVIERQLLTVYDSQINQLKLLMSIS
jgi:hypothetical protein